MLPGMGLDQYFSRVDLSGTSTILPDLLGSTLGLVNSSGAIGRNYAYGPFGQTTTSGTASTNAFQYTGREMDSTGLYFLRSRYYNPIAQRFISPDPIGLSGGQVNFYAYVFNQPTDWKDPLGLKSGSSGGSGSPPPTTWSWDNKNQRWVGYDGLVTYNGVQVPTGSSQIAVQPGPIQQPGNTPVGMTVLMVTNVTVYGIAGYQYGMDVDIALAIITGNPAFIGAGAGLGALAGLIYGSALTFSELGYLPDLPTLPGTP